MNDEHHLPWFALDVADWLDSPTVAVMSEAAQGIYLRLLCLQWRSKTQSISSDKNAIVALAGIRSTEALDEALKNFKPCGGGLRNARLYRERQEAEAQRAAATEHGKRGAKARWGAQRSAPPIEPPPASTAPGTFEPDEDSTGPPMLCPACGKHTHQSDKHGAPIIDSHGIPYAKCRALKCSAYGFMLYEDGHGFHPNTKATKQFFEGPKHEETDEEIEAETGLKVIRREKKHD